MKNHVVFVTARQGSCMVMVENLLLREREGEKSMYRRFGGEASEVVRGP